MDPFRDLRVSHKLKPGKNFNLLDWDPDLSGPKSKNRLESELDDISNKIASLHYKLFAENKQALLLILQGIDASGKDGTIRHVMRGLNPQSCSVKSYKIPNEEELSHDYLWRIHNSMPSRGHVGIFNRSQYEDIIEPRVNRSFSKKLITKRYRQINDFERYLSENNITLLKLFLYISKEEQKKRLLERIHNPTKHWKFSEADVSSYENWDKYMTTYSEILTHTDKKWAPWFIIPANVKYFRNWAVSNILLKVLESMNPQFPKINLDPTRYILD